MCNNNILLGFISWADHCRILGGRQRVQVLHHSLFRPLHHHLSRGHRGVGVQRQDEEVSKESGLRRTQKLIYVFHYY